MFFQRPALRAPLVFLTGGPGSGKGVLARRIPGCVHVSLGEVLREHLANPSHAGSIRLKELMQRGELLPDNEVLSISQQPEFKGQTPVLLDGFPRTFNQWKLLKAQRITPVAAIDISVKPETMRQRLLNRGREDDRASVIEHRIDDYLTKTKPMSDIILSQVPNALVIPADKLTPEEIVATAQEFLDNRVFLPFNTPSWLQTIS